MKTARCRLFLLALLSFLGTVGSTPTARANVYATDIRLNAKTADALVLTGQCLSVTYTLNQPATAGVRVELFSSELALRSLNLDPGQPGTSAGANTVVLPGTNELGQALEPGTYSIRITAAATNDTTWTELNPNDPRRYVYQPRGIAVNTNPKSPFFGRIYAGNCVDNSAYGNQPGDHIGILKWNANSSFAPEGPFSNGNYPWTDYWSPWKIEIANDDKVCISDFSAHGDVLTFDPAILSNSPANIFHASAGNYNAFAITRTGTNTQLWITDTTSAPNGAGLKRFNLTSNGNVAPNDPGTQILKPGTNSDLNIAPYDVAIDKSNRIYVVQYVTTAGSAAPRVLRFPAYDESGNPQTAADWSVGSGDTGPLMRAMGVAVDPTCSYVAVAARGAGSPGNWSFGGVTILNANDGTTLTNIQFGAKHDATDVAWDAAGNLYVTDNFASRWQVYSPPGTNSFTTEAIPTVIVVSTPVLSAPRLSPENFLFTLSGDANATYILQSSLDLRAWTPVSTNSTTNALLEVALPKPGTNLFYRALRTR